MAPVFNAMRRMEHMVSGAEGFLSVVEEITLWARRRGLADEDESVDRLFQLQRAVVNTMWLWGNLRSGTADIQEEQTLLQRHEEIQHIIEVVQMGNLQANFPQLSTLVDDYNLTLPMWVPQLPFLLPHLAADESEDL